MINFYNSSFFVPFYALIPLHCFNDGKHTRPALRAQSFSHTGLRQLLEHDMVLPVTTLLMVLPLSVSLFHTCPSLQICFNSYWSFRLQGSLPRYHSVNSRQFLCYVLPQNCVPFLNSLFLSLYLQVISHQLLNVHVVNGQVTATIHMQRAAVLHQSPCVISTPCFTMFPNTQHR